MQPRPPHPELDIELSKVATEPKALLRERYVALFGRDPPKSFGPDLLRRSVAQKMQENAYGGLSKVSQRELDRMVAALIAKPDARPAVARRAQFGTVLVRDWKGKSHRVRIMEEGFSYEERIFTNLSEIARLITGTRWNGPRFFGLRRPRSQENSSNQPPMSPSIANQAAINSPSKRHRANHGL